MLCKFENCNNDSFKDSDYCILHFALPHEKSPDFQEINELKNQESLKKKENGDFNFKGVKLFNIDFSREKFEDDLIFTGAIIKNDVLLRNATIEGDVWFDSADVGGDILLEGSNICGNASFYSTHIGGHVIFDKTHVNRYAWFEKAYVGGEASFNKAEIGSSLSFKEAQIEGNTSFYDAKIAGDAWFDKAEVTGDVFFDFVKVKGGLNFKNTKFKTNKSQEKASRKAKIVWEKMGNRTKADYYFYREMESKRKQKSFLHKYVELIVQYPFGYGVYPIRLLLSFFIVLLTFAFIYWILKGTLTPDAFTEKLRFSFLTMIIPAYGVIFSETGFYGVLNIVEACIGAFVWPTLMVTFARKYMR